MRKIFFISLSLLAFGMASAQTDSKTPAQQKPSEPMPQADTTSTNSQVRKEADVKNMDAVKTDDHPKVTPVPDSANDTVTKKKKRKASKKVA